MSATAAETSTLSPTFRGQHELETEGAENSDEGLLGMGYIVYIAAAILVGAVLVVVGVVSTRRRRRRRHAAERDHVASPKELEGDFEWDFEGEPQQFDMDERMGQLVSRKEPTSPTKDKPSRPRSTLINNAASPLPGQQRTTNAVCHLGEIDHLRVWSAETLTGSEGSASQLEATEELVLCDLCEGMGNLAPATHSCIECGDLYLCTKCHHDTHASDKANFQSHTSIEIAKDTDVRLTLVASNAPSTIAGSVAQSTSSDSPPRSTMSANARHRSLSTLISEEVVAPAVHDLNRLPFRSEMDPIRSQYIDMRRNEQNRKESTKQYIFYARDEPAPARRGTCTTLGSGQSGDVVNEEGEATAQQVTAPATVRMRTPNSHHHHHTSAELRALTSPDGTYVVTSETPIDQIPLNVKRELKGMPTRRQAMEMRRQAAQASRRQTEKCMRTRELLERRLSDMLIDVEKIADPDRSQTALQTRLPSSAESHIMSELDFEGLIVPENTIVTLTDGDLSTILTESTWDEETILSGLEECARFEEYLHEYDEDDNLTLLPGDVVAEVMADGDGTLSCASGSVFEVDSAQPANHLEVSSGSVQKRGVQANATGQQPRVDGNTPVYGETEDEREERQRLEVKERMKRMLHKVGVPTLQRTHTDMTDSTTETTTTIIAGMCGYDVADDDSVMIVPYGDAEPLSPSTLSPEVCRPPMSPNISQSVLHTVMDELRNALHRRVHE